ncbi:MAG: zinc-binding dehydrogenase [Phycisphaerales bacterium]|nr:MAG: zinc-binding dehydrogenase [Phycisphaerales bacterium]
MSKIVAAVMPAPRKALEICEFDEPNLEPNSALLRTTYSEVCGTDVHLMHGRLAGVPYPIIPGHVAVGVLEKIRGDIRDVHGRSFEEGDAVTYLDVHRTCHACWYCLVAKASTRCPQRKVYGITYGVDDGLTGGWAQAVYLKPGVHCIRLDGVDPRLFMAGGCALPTSLHAVDQAQVRIGETVLVLGAGPVGLSAVALADLHGAGKVLCIGAPAHRLEIARRMGASECLDLAEADEEQRRDWILELTEGRGPDVIIEATGAPIAVSQALRWIRDAGRVIVVGQYTDAGSIEVNPHTDINRKHVSVQGVWGSDFSHFYRSVQFLQNSRATKIYSEIVETEFKLAETNEALAAVEDGKTVKALILPAA